jgi:hypothetical protein
MPEQLNFGLGLNANTPAEKLPDGFVQAASNIDFSLESGAARVRRGTVKNATIGTAIRDLFRHYTSESVAGSLFYAFTPTTIYVSANDGSTFSSLQTGLSAGDNIGIGTHKNFTYITSGTTHIKYDGTTKFEWMAQSPGTAPTPTLSTTGGLTVDTDFIIAEGGNEGSIFSGTATGTTSASPFRIQIDANSILTNLNTLGGIPIDDYGVDRVDLYFSEPRNILRISRDYSIGDTSYTSYWHTEMNLEDRDVDDALPASLTVINAELDQTQGEVDNDTIQQAISRARRRQRPPRSRTSNAAEQFNSWDVARTKFELIGPNLVAGWGNIGAARIVIEAIGEVEVRVRNWKIYGDTAHPLNDAEVGYIWWESWARIDSGGVIVWESALSPASARIKTQAAQANVNLLSVPTGTSHGFTHKLIYRQGGMLPVPYRVGTFTGTNADVFTDTLSDVKALMRNQRGLTGLRSTLPTELSALSDSLYQGRMFGGFKNRLIWSLPGNPSSFPTLSDVTVSYEGDNIKKLIVWPPGLVIVNRDSVYEMVGSVFEGQDQNWTLQRSGSQHGAGSTKSCIKTPHGILLLSQDGFFMYTPSQGVDNPITWANENLKPAFEGPGAADPAALDGSRVPAINLGNLFNSVAAYRDDKLFVGMPTGTSTHPNTLFVLDFNRKRTWHYTYPWTFRSILWDRQDNRLFLGGDDGYLYRAEIGVNDSNGEQAAGVPWSVKTRAWTTPSDTLLENISVERRGDCTVTGIYDGTSTITASALTGTGRNWLTPALNGTIANKVEFLLSGTQSDNPVTLYNISWDALPEPVRIQFYRTPGFNNNYEGEKLWDVHYADMAITDFGTNTETVTGTVFGTVFVDNTAIMTNTYVCPPTGRQIHPRAFPFDTFGDIGHTIYTSPSSTRFKLWETSYEVRNEPPRITNYQSDITSLEEQICDAIDIDINPLGTVLSTVFVDNTAVQTATWTGTRRQSYTWALPNELYGRTIFANHVAQGGGLLKHYKTWFHLRPEPDRWQNFVTDKESGDESFIHAVDCDLNCLGNTVLGTAMVDNIAVGTFTFTGSQRQSYVNAVTEDTYGRTMWMIYNVSGGARFKHYKTWWHKEAEPDRLTLVQWGPQTFPSDSIIKTWVAELNPLGTSTGTIIVEGTAVATNTFVGTRRQTFNIGLPNITVGGDVDVVYTNSTRLKHYSTTLEAEPKPFGKKTWLISYKKSGGASQLDFARFFEIDAEPGPGTEASPTTTSTLTSTWEIDGTAFQTNTLTFTGREWRTRIPFGPGGRGSIFQQRLNSSQDFRVWHSSVDFYRVGRKGVSFYSVAGTPDQMSALQLDLLKPRVD